MNLPRILILDDLAYWSPEVRVRLCRELGLMDISSTLALPSSKGFVAAAVFASGQVRHADLVSNDVDEALRSVELGWGREDWRWAMVLLDLQFDHGPVQSGAIDPDTNWPGYADQEYGLRVLQAMTRRWPDPAAGPGNCELPIVILSTLERVEKGRMAGRAGARAYVEKDDLDRKALEALLHEHGLIEDLSGRVRGRSTSLLRTLRSAREVARNATGNLLLLGEPGSGKTWLADYLHEHSGRREHRLQKFTVGAGMEPSLLKAQLFGFWYGSYTPADKSEAGLAERAHRSTLMLDEIANLPISGQTELLEFGRLEAGGLRALQRLGAFPTAPEKAHQQAKRSIVGRYDDQTQRIFVDVLLVAATNQPIYDPDFCASHGFRYDLFVRLGQEYHRYIVFPRLKDRLDDLQLLFEHFLCEASSVHEGRWPKVIDREVLERLRMYDWPGNVAELKGVAVEAEKASRNWDELLPRHLPPLGSTRVPVKVYASSAVKNDLPGLEPVGRAAAESPAGVQELAEIMCGVRINGRPGDLYGSLPSLQRSYGAVLLALIEHALELTRRPTTQQKSEMLGDLNPTTAMSLLAGRQLKTPEAADEIKRLIVLLPTLPDPSTPVGKAFAWAEKRRGPAKRRFDE